MKRSYVVALACLVAIVVLLPATVLGHAHLSASIPARDAVVTSPLSEVRLQFSEAVETRFSVFKVYPLDTTGVEDVAAAARNLVAQVIRARNDDAQRADAGLATQAATSSEIVIRLKPDLAPGTYVVMWRVLSVDTHTSEGHFVFEYKPEA